VYFWIFAAGSLLGLTVVSVGAWLRTRAYATFVGILLLIHTFTSVSLARDFEPVGAVYAYLQCAVFLHFLSLIRPRMRPLWYRTLVSIPASFFFAGTFLALPWAIVAAIGFEPYGFFVPYVIAAIGVYQSMRTRQDGEVDVVVGDGIVELLGRHRSPRHRESRPLRIVQISDTHLGPFMSEARLRRICERAVERRPDLIFLTGDFLTMESQGDPEILGRALAPLAAMPGRVFACRGNHDHEAPRTVDRAMASIGARVLDDDSTVVETEVGPVQILGFDFAWFDRAQRMKEVCARHPRIPDTLRLVLLHDPGAFRHLPPGEGDLVFSGHTHGGQLGLVSLGLPWTFVSTFTKLPDHGLWARGPDRLYVHRGTGHYGFPLRLGVPAEESVLRVHRSPASG
jgi:uncharacterized protein